MLDVRALNQTFVNKIRQDKDGKEIQWLKIKCLRFEKNNPGVVKFHYIYDGPYLELHMIVEEQKKTVLTWKRKNDKMVAKIGNQDLEEKIQNVVPKVYLMALVHAKKSHRDCSRQDKFIM